MIVLLPPSETKAVGGEGVLDPASLGFAALRGRRRTTAAALRRVRLAEAPAVLGLGLRTAHEARWNRGLTTGPTLPAVERYTGVLYDALDVRGLDPAARAWVDGRVVIASALFGLLRPSDRIPAYRLSGSTSLPDLPLRAHWSGAIAAVLRATGEWVLDARSESYVALGPAPAGSAFLTVETVDGRALNHWNKHAKGALVRALATTRADVDSRDALLAWAAGAGVPMRPRGPDDVGLIV